MTAPPVTASTSSGPGLVPLTPLRRLLVGAYSSMLCVALSPVMRCVACVDVAARSRLCSPRASACPQMHLLVSPWTFVALSAECTSALDLHLAGVEAGWGSLAWLRVHKGVAWVLTHRVPSADDGMCCVRVAPCNSTVVSWLAACACACASTQMRGHVWASARTPHHHK